MPGANINYLTRVFGMASSAENSKSFTGAPIPYSIVIRTLVMQHLQEGLDSQAQWWRICILLVGTVVTGTNRLSTYPFTGVLLAFSSFFCFSFVNFSYSTFLYISFFNFFFFCFNLLFIIFSNFYLFLVSFFYLSPHFFPTFFLSSWALSPLSLCSYNVVCR